MHQWTLGRQLSSGYFEQTGQLGDNKTMSQLDGGHMVV